MNAKSRRGLTALAESIDSHALYKHALFLGATLAVILIYGYYFGTFDQFVHIPDLKT